jgi:hypothetical protein
MVQTDSRLITHPYGQSSTPSENSEENHAFSRPQPSAFNLPQQTAEYRNTSHYRHFRNSGDPCLLQLTSNDVQVMNASAELQICCT